LMDCQSLQRPLRHKNAELFANLQYPLFNLVIIPRQSRGIITPG
jgi:hypothetical protein